MTATITACSSKKKISWLEDRYTSSMENVNSRINAIDSTITASREDISRLQTTRTKENLNQSVTIIKYDTSRPVVPETQKPPVLSEEKHTTARENETVTEFNEFRTKTETEIKNLKAEIEELKNREVTVEEEVEVQEKEKKEKFPLIPLIALIAMLVGVILLYIEVRKKFPHNFLR